MTKLRQLAINQQKLCQAFLDGKIDEKEFRGSLMHAAFEASGVTDEEMQAFNSVLEALYKMKSIGRDEIVDVVKESLGHTDNEIVDVIEPLKLPKIGKERV